MDLIHGGEFRWNIPEWPAGNPPRPLPTAGQFVRIVWTKTENLKELLTFFVSSPAGTEWRHFPSSLLMEA